MHGIIPKKHRAAGGKTMDADLVLRAGADRGADIAARLIACDAQGEALLDAWAQPF